MIQEEIAEYAFQNTKGDTKFEIPLKNGTKVVGFFEGNTMYDDHYKQNKWKFVITPINLDQRQTILNGDDFLSIRIIKVAL